MPGRRLVSGGMWLALLLPSWLPAHRLGAAGAAGRRHVPARARLAVGHPPDHGAVRRRAAARAALRAVLLPGDHAPRLAGSGRSSRTPPGCTARRRWQAMRLIVPILAPAIMSALAIGFAESISDFGVAATLAYNSNFTLAHLRALRGDRQLPAVVPARRGDVLAARRGGRRSRCSCRRGRCAAGPTRSCRGGRGRRCGGGCRALEARRGRVRARAVLPGRSSASPVSARCPGRCWATTAARSRSRWANYTGALPAARA